MRHLRLFLSILGMISLLFVSMPGVFAEQGAASTPVIKASIPLPQPMNNQDDPKRPGTWFLGATPPNADPQKPPIVFVQGLHGEAQSYWWGETEYHGPNDMYALAYQNGYRTAFVQLYDASGPARNPWNNGQLLAQTLQKIYNHFGQKVNIVAHSKGGIDTQAALVHYGAYPYVSKVFTLASPHHGSHLADLAYSWYAGWLADLLGRQDEGTESLQTGNMAQFREQTDSHANVSKNIYYTSAGTSWGPTFSALWFGGSYLSQYGDNDGLVNVWSTQLPYATHRFTANLDHDQMRKGSDVFSKISADISRMTSANIPLTESYSTPSKDQMNKTAAEEILAGGPLSEKKWVEENISIENPAKEAIISVWTKYKDTQILLISPSGKTYSRSSKEYRQHQEKTFFKGAYQQLFVIPNPESGTWKVKIQSQKKDAYFLTTHFTGTSTMSVQFDPTVKTNQSIPLKIELKNPEKYDLSTIELQMRIVSTDKKRSTLVPSRFNGKGTLTPQLKAPAQSGTMNVTIEVRGKTKEGKPFERNETVSIHVAK
ncbi:esterase/lipase family protein [Thermoflavimicrobium dichotomicum]|uniref:Proprotein convertase P-domain-containing protein n=1 Tax=Thermoflavimicrobium dichotomicum TaxID=46223 RepID=A0A1I3LJX0_9BACL|nr:proprotein convertase P-domain-containing protein [Thermoflavimicrobium dichotomicum]SFI84776.1 Proprotein convertase P-domain-containing protein [Thermoflavimicrobium dichotomicum]